MVLHTALEQEHGTGAEIWRLKILMPRMLYGKSTLKSKICSEYHTFSEKELHLPTKRLEVLGGTAVAQWLRCCATNRKVAGWIPAGVIGIFH